MGSAYELALPKPGEGVFDRLVRSPKPGRELCDRSARTEAHRGKNLEVGDRWHPDLPGGHRQLTGNERLQGVWAQPRI